MCSVRTVIHFDFWSPQRYEDAIGDLEVETEQRQVQLQEVHEARIETNLNEKIDVEEQNYWNALEREPLKVRSKVPHHQ